MNRRFLAGLGVAVLVLGALPVVAQERPASFRSRVQVFWAWFASHADAYRPGLLAREPSVVAQVTQELGAKLKELAPGLAFSAENGAVAESVRICLVPGDDRLTQLLGAELVAAMPAIPGWEFVAWRPPGDMTQSLGKLGAHDLMPSDFRVACSWDGDALRLDLAVWHEGFTLLVVKDREQMATRLIERALGAAMLRRCPHDIRLLESAPADDEEGVLTGDELYPTLVEFLRGEEFDVVQAPEEVLEHYGPTEREHAAGTRLGDTLSGASRFIDLVADYQLLESTETLGRVAQSGAGAGFVAFSHALERRPLDTDSNLAISTLRDAVANDLDARLRAAHAGTVVGWVDGREREYVDVLFFDEAAALPIVREALGANASVTAAELRSFDSKVVEPLAKLK
ncbi:MAG: hypothetical protein K8S98_00950 [Planctomycetes bacterium]|nr:hypothetical protein [Planctomycetota bacterium]